jgi:processing peptidase subunit alpha
VRAQPHCCKALLAHSLTHTHAPTYPPPSARQTISFQRDESRAQPSVLVAENLWAAAYGADTPEGRPEKCLPSRVAGMTAPTLRAFTARNFVAPRMVLAGVGVSQAELLAAVAGSPFAGVPGASALPALAPTPRPRTLYLGGEQRLSPDWSALPPTVAATTSKTHLTHIMLAFPTAGWSEDATVPLCVADTLLGGGSSFSAGGPGKGMYSRLYREALNAYPWLESANAFSTRLYKCGMVGIYGTAPPEYGGALAQIMCDHLARLGSAFVREEELGRARNQLASSVLMNLETRGTLVEDIGRQLLSHGKRMHPAELTGRIQRTTAGNIRGVMREAMEHPPALSVVGDVSTVPSYEEFQRFFASAARKWGASPEVSAARVAANTM